MAAMRNTIENNVYTMCVELLTIVSQANYLLFRHAVGEAMSMYQQLGLELHTLCI